VLTQEVDNHLWQSHFKPWAANTLDLQGIHHPRQSGVEGLVLLYNTRRFELLCHRQIYFKEQISKDPSPHESEHPSRLSIFHNQASKTTRGQQQAVMQAREEANPPMKVKSCLKCQLQCQLQCQL
jgi:hypothetical protein